jgi:uncharacterized protein YkwD
VVFTIDRIKQGGAVALIIAAALTVTGCGGGGAASPAPNPGNNQNGNQNGGDTGSSLPDTSLGDLGGYPFPFEPRVSFPPAETYRDNSSAGDTALERWLKNSYEPLPAQGSAAGVYQNASLKAWADQIVSGMNAQRAAKGLGALSVELHLVAAAQSQARDMALRNYFAHDTPDGITTWDRFKALRFAYYDHAGENAAKGQESAAEVVSGWLNSEKHRKNMLNPDYRYVGVGVYFDSTDKTYPVHVIADFADFSHGFEKADWYERGEVYR